LESSWLKSLGLKGLGLKLGVENSGVEMSFNRLTSTNSTCGLTSNWYYSSDSRHGCHGSYRGSRTHGCPLGRTSHNHGGHLGPH
jgi:hypothetical protein